MKTLTSYTKNNHDFTLVIRSGDVAIFHGKSKISSSETWEVIRVQSHNGRDIAGIRHEPAEYPPGNEQWGAKGWTCRTEDAARDRLARAVNDAGKRSAAHPLR